MIADLIAAYAIYLLIPLVAALAFALLVGIVGLVGKYFDPYSKRNMDKRRHGR